MFKIYFYFLDGFASAFSIFVINLRFSLSKKAVRSPFMRTFILPNKL